MILAWLIVILLAAGIVAAVAARWSVAFTRWVSLAATLLDFALVVLLWVHHAGEVTAGASGTWLEQMDWTWIPEFGIHFHLALDTFQNFRFVFQHLL